ncbi:MAG: alpha-glucosidase/alpha-galactosidase, partial [Sulfolobus sp.]|nr:alpha-glucosidase/alpha-galactosidase [Sulfolobus sp.]
MAKICIIGAGSVTFGPNITRDLALTKSLYNNKISLMDIDKERLEMSYSLMKRYFQETGAEYEVEKTLDRRECIRDASVILNVASAISNEEILTMIETAEKYGYYRGIDAQEWNMVSNYLTFTGYKNLKIALDVAR